MRHISSIAFSVIAIAVLAAAVALWLPSGAQAGPPPQTTRDPAPNQDAPNRTPYFATGASIAAQDYPRNTAITAWTLPTAQGGDGVLTYSLTPALPAGLAFDAATQTISGTPTVTQNAAAATYTYAVTDADGDASSLTFTIKIDGEPTFGSDTPAWTYDRGAAITNRTLPAAEHGNTPVAYTLSPAPPDGLAFNAATRVLSGTPTTTQNAVTYTLTATDSDGDTGTTTFTIKVDGAPEFPGSSDTLPAWIYAKGTAISWGMPAAEHGNTPVTYSLTPAPPAGLAFNAATHTLAGAATTPQSARDYTYTATDADGDTATLTFSIAVAGPPTFGDATVAARTYTRNVAIDDLELPAADGGKAPLTYSLTTLPAGLTFDAATRTLSGTPTAQQTAMSYTYTVTDADSVAVSLTFNIAVIVDYDADDDQLIEMDSLAKLNAIRWDVDGDGVVDTGTSAADTAKYNAAYSDAPTGMGCKLVDHDDNAATDQTPVCIGYELAADLDFDTDGDGATYTVSSTGVVTGDADDAYYNGGKGWDPIGTSANRFTATFDGNGKTIANLFIKDASRNSVGLFGYTGDGSLIERLGVINLNVTGRNLVGGLVGKSGYSDGTVVYDGTISASYATGFVAGRTSVGGLAGEFFGTINASYAIVHVVGSVSSGGHGVGGLVGWNFGAITTSYATGSVSGNYLVGGLVGGTSGSISGSYSTGSVTGSSYGVGGLVGDNIGAISGSYATGSVTGSSHSVGGLAGRSFGTISGSYATGSVSGGNYAGGLAGVNASTIIASYAAGAVNGTGNNVGGLVGKGTHTDNLGTENERNYIGTVTNSYWDTGTTGQSTSAGGTGKTTRELQSLTSYTGIYANWNANLDGVAGNDDPWDFGGNRQYPVLKYSGLEPSKQRQTFIQSDNWNAPVVGEPVTAGLHIEGNPAATWQWQSSADGTTWTNIAGATAATYTPVVADAASGGKFLRAQATFTVSGASQTLTTVNTAKVIAASAATSGSAATGTPIVGEKLRYDNAAYATAGATNRTAWRWQRCDDAAMTTNCKLAQSGSAAQTYTEYTPVAGTDTDVGKYLRAYAYYADTANSNAWTRTQTPVLGPVVAAAPATVPTTP